MSSAHALAPSDCKARNADSTCNSAVQRDSSILGSSASTLYNGPLGGVPAQGYAYWGYDFLADANGVASAYEKDMFVNHSAYKATIRLSFNIPTNHACGHNCLPGVQFFFGPSWGSYFPTPVVNGDTVTYDAPLLPHQSFGWAIGLWESTNARLTVIVGQGVSTTLTELGLPLQPAIAQEIAAVTTLCDCVDSSRAACSKGSHFSNGLDGPWYHEGITEYVRAGSFNDCPRP